MTTKRLMAFSILLAPVLIGSPGLSQDISPSPLTMGVYECHDQMANLTPTMMFGLLDASKYENYDGVIGTYNYDPTTGIIEVGTDTVAPARFSRVSETTFRALHEDGSLAGFVCPLNLAKDAAHPPW